MITEKEFRVWINGFLNALGGPLPDWFPTDEQVDQLADSIDEEILKGILNELRNE